MGGKVKCRNCGQILHSMSRHDFQQCGCENRTFVDGGFDYMRIGGVDMNEVDVIEHSHCDKCGLDIKKCSCPSNKTTNI